MTDVRVTACAPFEALAAEVERAAIPEAGILPVAAAIVSWSSLRVPNEVDALAKQQLRSARLLLEYAREHREAFERWRGSPNLAERFVNMQEEILAWGAINAGSDKPNRHSGQRTGSVEIAGLAYPAIAWSSMPTDREVLLSLVVRMLEGLGVAREAARMDGCGYDIAGRVMYLAGLSRSAIGDTKRQFFIADAPLLKAITRANYDPARVLDADRLLNGYGQLAATLVGTDWTPVTLPTWATARRIANER